MKKTEIPEEEEEEDLSIDPMRQPLLAHLIELRRRMIWSFLSIIVGFCVCYAFAPWIYGFLVRPLADAMEGEQRRLIYTGLTEAFATYIKLSLWGGCVAAFPVVAAQAWMFMAPGLYKEERRVLLPFIVASPVLFMAGAALAYYMVFPMAWKFFLGFESPAIDGGLPIQLEARVSEYLSLSMTIIFAFGLAFQLPVVLVLLARAGVLSAAGLAKFRRYAIVLSFAAAAVLTPPDVISQISLAVPLVILYEISVLAARWVGKNNQ